MTENEKQRALEREYWAAYGGLMESIRRGERLTFERWGQVREGRMPRADAASVAMMRQLMMSLDDLWFGFEDGGERRNEPPADWDTVAGYAATTDCNQVGQVLLMRPVGATTWERVLVADCPGDGSTLDWMLANNIAVELDYNLFTRWADGHGVPLEIEMRPAGVRDYEMRWVA